MGRFFLILFFSTTLWAVGEDKPKPSADASRAPNEPTVEEVQTIRKILELPPERLARMRSAMERIEKMSPEERKEFAASLAKLETATPEERKKAFKEMREKNPGNGINARVFEYHLKQLSPDDAKAERANFVKLSAEERQKYIRGLMEKYAAEIPKIKAEAKAKGPDKDKEEDDAKEADRNRRRPGADPRPQPPGEKPPAG